MHDSKMIMSAVLEDAYLTLEQLAALCAVEPEWVLQHVAEGLLTASKLEGDDRYFSSVELTRARRILSIERDFEALPELAALVADMQEELESLRRQLRQMQQY